MTRITSIALFSLMTTAAQAFCPRTFERTSVSTMMASISPVEEQESDKREGGGLLDRRIFGKAIASSATAMVGSTLLPDWASAVPPTGRPKTVLGDDRVYFKGRVTLQNEDIPAEIRKANNKALILTARPKNMANVPPEVNAAGRGSVPAVFTAIIPNPQSFPQTFQLTSNDLTPEGDFGLSGDPYWWADEPEWEISARVDTDGSISTLDPTDLVGRTFTSQVGEDKPEAEVCVAVQKRGVFGSRFQRKETA
jgi:hypothetical protein